MLFDGKGNWLAFYTKFEKYANMQHWDEEERKEYLCWCLEGKASEFYTTTVINTDNITYRLIIRKFERRFGFRELPETARITFNNARQQPEETLEDWADRVTKLAFKAYRNLPEDYMSEQAVLRFCLGTTSKDAGEVVANLRPATIDDALG